jgi:acetyl/propionyl-CoA carboxylase alpha subunit
VRILSLNPPQARIALDGAADETVAFVVDGDAIHLARGGQSYSLTNTTHAPVARAAAASDGRLVAPMNGRIAAVHAVSGDTAEAGRALIVMEAMKMEHALSVPQAMRVSAVHVVPGAQVKPGQLLVELEPL